MTQMEYARKGIATEAMKIVASEENVSLDKVVAAVAEGTAVISLNIHHTNCHPVGVGRLFKTKVNANLGRSVTHSGRGDELEKLNVALMAGADFVMDLSVGDDIKAIRQGMLDASPKPLGTVPVYETISRLKGDIPQMDPSLLLQVIKEQAEQGVDFMTLHAGLLLKHIPLAMKRKMGIVSRGGAIMAEWMLSNNRENPLYENWDKVLDILPDRKHNHLVSYFSSIPKDERHRVKHFVCDMWKPYVEMAHTYFPNAEVIIDMRNGKPVTVKPKQILSVIIAKLMT